MKKLVVKEINNYDYIFIDSDNKEYNLNIEFYTDNKPAINDAIYFPDEILKEKNMFSFGELLEESTKEEKDLIKVVIGNKEFYLQRYYG